MFVKGDDILIIDQKMFHKIADEEADIRRELLNIERVEHFDRSARIWFRHLKKSAGSWPTQIEYSQGKLSYLGPYEGARIRVIHDAILRRLKGLSQMS